MWHLSNVRSRLVYFLSWIAKSGHSTACEKNHLCGLRKVAEMTNDLSAKRRKPTYKQGKKDTSNAL